MKTSRPNSRAYVTVRFSGSSSARVAQRLTAELELYMTGVVSIGPGIATHSARIDLGWQVAARAERQDDVGRLWKDFRACEPFWSHAAA